MAEEHKRNKEQLKFWQDRLAGSAAAYAAEEAKMDEREALYQGEETTIRPLTEHDLRKDGTKKTARHVRNIVSENIESLVSSSIPQPKVTARRKRDEGKAKLIEDMIRNELNRMSFEVLNDQMERTVPIQGGGLFLVEWDNSLRTHTTIGELAISTIHPKQVIPQDGVYTGIEDMDFVILRLPQTKEYIRRKYGIDVVAQSESEPEVKGTAGATDADDLVTQYIAYYRNTDGGIGLFSWINDIPLESLVDYQARRLRRCVKCGAVEPIEAAETPDVVCSHCGGRNFKISAEEYEEIYTQIITSNGLIIPGATMAVDQNGMPALVPTRIPFYKPNVYPVVLQKNISVFGRFLGDSDVDKIRDQQNTVNRLEMKIIDRLIKAGTRVTLPDRADFRIDPEDGEKWYIGNAADRSCIGVYEFSGDLQFEMTYMAQVYEEARQILGITDSFQGRQDTTAKSGVAKQFSAAQAAGRQESKRVMKDAAYAELFKLIFQFKLAYTDEPRPVVSVNDEGDTQYENFNRYDFLEKDDAGEYFWNDQFMFACDTSAPLANNREQMWQNTTAHLTAGAYGNPAEIDTLILYWTKMELLHYPGASDTKKALEKRKVDQLAQQQMLLELGYYQPTHPEYYNTRKEERKMADGYKGKIKNSGAQDIKAPNQSTDAKKGTVKTGNDLRSGK